LESELKPRVLLAFQGATCSLFLESRQNFQKKKKKKAHLMRKAVKRRHPHNFGQSTGVVVTLGDERAISDVEV
jgi:hypothetical protein